MWKERDMNLENVLLCTWTLTMLWYEPEIVKPDWNSKSFSWKAKAAAKNTMRVFTRERKEKKKTKFVKNTRKRRAYKKRHVEKHEWEGKGETRDVREEKGKIMTNETHNKMNDNKGGGLLNIPHMKPNSDMGEEIKKKMLNRKRGKTK